MLKRPQTVGELFEHFQKLEQHERASSRGSSKLEHIEDDYILSTLKTEPKMEYDSLKEEEDDQPLPLLPKTREVTQMVSVRGVGGPGLRMKLDFVESPARRKQPELAALRFQHEDVWDPTRQLRCRVSSDRICIANMVPLPPDKHRLNQPRPYKPLEPMKKKMYRPVVPRAFHSGYDEFLKRRQRNTANKAANEAARAECRARNVSEECAQLQEIDLGVWNVDEVLEECFQKNLIPLAALNKFINRNGHLQIRRFLEAWQGGQLPLFDFERASFTLLDHRRLAELLMHTHAKEYTRGPVEALHPDVKEFIAASYRLNSDDYAEAYLLLDEISESGWWADLKARLTRDIGSSNQKESQKSEEAAAYFRLKETIAKPPLPANMEYDKVAKSEYIRDLLGPIPVQDAQTELEKILSMKHKSNRSERPDDSATTYHRNDEDEDFEESHDPTEVTSRRSNHGQPEHSGPDWELFEED